jgi:tRNA(Ile)-lysidine synthase
MFEHLLPLRLQALPPRAARFCLGVDSFLRNELGLDLRGRTLLLGFSGGPDSTALLLALHCLAPRLGVSLRAAHLDHGLRPDSAAEAGRAAAFCAGLGVECAVRRVDALALSRALGAGVEDAGRQARYAFFAELQDAAPGSLLAVGHQLNDLAEDQLMRQMRGVGWPELAGMPAWDPQRRLLRPLLLSPRRAGLAFLRALGAESYADPANADPANLRNRVRVQILPLFLRENPSYLDHAARLWRLAAMDREVLEPAAPLPAPGPDGSVLLPRTELEALPQALRLRRMKAALESLGPGQPLFANLLRLDQAFCARRSRAVLQFPGRKAARVGRAGIRFFPANALTA